MSDRSQGPAWQWRPEIIGATEAAYAEYGQGLGHPGMVPYEVLEAIAQRESNGIPNAYNSTPWGPNGEHATGIMQIVPNSGVASTYTQATGNTVTEEQLYDPYTSFEVAAIGLGEKARDIQTSSQINVETAALFDTDADLGRVRDEQGIRDWATVARIGWYGAGWSRDGQTYPTKHVRGVDGKLYGDGPAWQQDIANYMAGFSDSRDRTRGGEWRDPADETRKKWRAFESGPSLSGIVDAVEGAYGVVTDPRGAVEDVVKDAASGYAGAIDKAIPRVAMIGAGIALLAGGLVILKTSAMSNPAVQAAAMAAV